MLRKAAFVDMQRFHAAVKVCERVAIQKHARVFVVSSDKMNLV